MESFINADPLELVLLVLVAAASGAMGQMIGGYARSGLFVTTGLGFIGAIIGTWIARQYQLPELFSISVGTFDFPVVWSVIGGAIFVTAINLVRRKPL